MHKKLIPLLSVSNIVSQRNGRPHTAISLLPIVYAKTVMTLPKISRIKFARIKFSEFKD